MTIKQICTVWKNEIGSSISDKITSHNSSNLIGWEQSQNNQNGWLACKCLDSEVAVQRDRVHELGYV